MWRLAAAVHGQLTMVDWLAHSWNRAGLSCVGQLGIDALHNPLGTLSGPAVSQVVNAATDQITETLVRAVPIVNKSSDLMGMVRD